MSHETPRSVLAPHRDRLGKTPRLANASQMARVLVSLCALAGLGLLAACSLPGNTSTGHGCSDKVVQSITTNKAVKGLWACLNSTLQNNLHASTGSDGDGALITPGMPAPNVISTKYVGEANGVDVYTVLVQPANGALQVYVISIWTDGSGKVSNLGVDGGVF